MEGDVTEREGGALEDKVFGFNFSFEETDWEVNFIPKELLFLIEELFSVSE